MSRATHLAWMIFLQCASAFFTALAFGAIYLIHDRTKGALWPSVAVLVFCLVMIWLTIRAIRRRKHTVG